MTDQSPPPPGNDPPPRSGGYPPPPSQGGYPPPTTPGGYQPPPSQGGYPPGGYQPPPQQGGYPPGGYQPPQQGGYPQPAAGGYPRPGGPGYPGTQYNVGEAFTWAWGKFSANAGPLIVATLVYGLIMVAIQTLFSILSAMLQSDDVTSYSSDASGFAFSYSLSSPGAIVVSILSWVVTLVVGGAIQSAYVSGVLDIANGQQVTTGSFFKPRSVGNVIVATLIVGILTSIGFALLIVPGIVVSIFLMFTVIALLDRNLSPIDAIKASFDVTKSNFGQVLLTWLVIVFVAAVGALLCLVGLLVALPLVVLIEVYAFRKLSGGQVAELNPQPLPPGPQSRQY